MGAWLRGEPLVESDGWISLRAGTEEWYSPLLEQSLAFDLASISTIDDVEPFVRRYGLLWHAVAGPEGRERWSRWELEATRLYGAGQTTSEIRAVLAGSLSMDAFRERWQDSIAAIVEHECSTDQELLAHATEAMGWMLNQRLRDVRHSVIAEQAVAETGRPGRFLATPLATTLLGFAYYQLSQLILGQVPMATCEGCSRLFAKSDPRQRFHDAACASRARYQRWATRNRPATSRRQR